MLDKHIATMLYAASILFRNSARLNRAQYMGLGTVLYLCGIDVHT